VIPAVYGLFLGGGGTSGLVKSKRIGRNFSQIQIDGAIAKLALILSRAAGSGNENVEYYFLRP
jgi:hypothetical protein